jgi:hypothetical protein
MSMQAASSRLPMKARRRMEAMMGAKSSGLESEQ